MRCELPLTDIIVILYSLPSILQRASGPVRLPLFRAVQGVQDVRQSVRFAGPVLVAHGATHATAEAQQEPCERIRRRWRGRRSEDRRRVLLGRARVDREHGQRVRRAEEANGRTSDGRSQAGSSRRESRAERRRGRLADALPCT